MKKTIKDIQKISFLFFLLTGILHIGSNLFIANSLYIKTSTLIFKIVDIPFILTGIIYSLASLRLLLTKEGKNHKILDITLAVLTSISLLLLILINLFITNLPR